MVRLKGKPILFIAITIVLCRLALAIDVSNCTSIDNPGNYTLNQSIINHTLTDSCINITSPHVSLDCNGFEIYSSVGGVAGIYSNATNTTIKNCNITMNNTLSGTYAIHFHRADDSAVYDSFLNRTEEIIRVNESNGLTIENVYFGNYNGFYAMRIYSSDNLTINNSEFVCEGDYSILYEEGKNATITNNNFVSSSMWGTWHNYFNEVNYTYIEGNNYNGSGWMIYYYNSKDAVIRNNTLSHGSEEGIWLQGTGSGLSSNFLIANNTIWNVSDTGMRIDAYGVNISILNNLINKTGNKGVEVYGYNSTFSNNRITDTYAQGLDLLYYNWTISNNIFEDIYNTGMFLETRDSIITNNTVNSAFYHCLSVFSSHNNSFYNNSLLNCSYNSSIYSGIYIGSSLTSVFSGNTLNLSQGYGISFANSDHILIKDTSLEGIEGADVSSDQWSQNNTLLNVTYETGAGNETVAAGGELIRQWYYKAYVNDTSGNSISEANVTAFNASDDYQFNLTTDGTGYTPQEEIIEYVNNGTRQYYSNYSLYADNQSDVDAKSYNITSNVYEDVFTITNDSTNPSINFSCSPTTVNVGSTITCTCSATDFIDPSPHIEYEVNPPTTTAGTYNAVCYANDSAGNSANFTIGYTVNSLSSPVSPGGGGGGSSYTAPKENDTNKTEDKKSEVKCEVIFDYPEECEALEQCKIYYNFYDLLRKEPYLGKQKSKCYLQGEEVYYTETKCDTGKPIVMNKVEKGNKKDLEIYTTQKNRKKVKKQIQISCSNYTNKTPEEIIREINETITDYETNQTQNQTEESTEDQDTIIIIDEIVVDTKKVIEQGKVKVNYTLVVAEKGEGEYHVADINLNSLPEKLDLDIYDQEDGFVAEGCDTCVEYPYPERRKIRIILLYFLLMLLAMLAYAFYRVESDRKKGKI